MFCWKIHRLQNKENIQIRVLNHLPRCNSFVKSDKQTVSAAPHVLYNVSPKCKALFSDSFNILVLFPTMF